jgi:hypothetical protein
MSNDANSYSDQLNSIAAVANHMQTLAANLQKTHMMLQHQQQLASKAATNVQQLNNEFEAAETELQKIEAETQPNTINEEDINVYTTILKDRNEKIDAIARLSAMLQNDYQVSQQDLNELTSSFEKDVDAANDLTTTQ